MVNCLIILLLRSMYCLDLNLIILCLIKSFAFPISSGLNLSFWWCQKGKNMLRTRKSEIHVYVCSWCVVLLRGNLICVVILRGNIVWVLKVKYAISLNAYLYVYLLSCLFVTIKKGEFVRTFVFDTSSLYVSFDGYKQTQLVTNKFARGCWN